jgi:hypothetical protein
VDDRCLRLEKKHECKEAYVVGEKHLTETHRLKRVQKKTLQNAAAYSRQQPLTRRALVCCEFEKNVHGSFRHIFIAMR